MSQTNIIDDDAETDYDQLKSFTGADRRELDVGGDDHDLGDMESERQAPIEAVAKNVVQRYDERSKAIREFMANAHTATIQRCRIELLRQTDLSRSDVSEMGVRETIETAKTETDYEPQIRVVYRRNPEEETLKIEDNGIGVSKDTAYAIRDIGLSGWHMDGSTNGMFGQGTMSGFLLSGLYGEFHMTTYSILDDANYRVAWKLTDLNQLPGGRDDYGTEFVFPTFCDEAKDIRVRDKVQDYAEGMIIPVVYEEYDERGKQSPSSDDYMPTYIEDLYSDDAPTVSFENDAVRAVWSTDSSGKTWCGYQPIDRNTSGFGRRYGKMPSSWDMRVKVEDGSIVEVPDDADDSLVGKVPVSKSRYEHIDDDQKDRFVVQSEVPDGSIIAPSPTDDRDRFEKKHVDEFVDWVSAKLYENFKSQVADLLDNMDEFEEIADLSERDRQLLLRGISEFGPSYGSSAADTWQDTLENEIGVRPSESYCEKLDEMNQRLSIVPRPIPDHVKPRRKTDRDDEKVWKIVSETADADVYIGQSLTSRRKVELAHELDENNRVVAVDASDYDKWQDMFGWKLIKNLPSRDFENKLDVDLDDDFLDEWDPAHGADVDDSGSSSTSGNTYDDERAKKRRVKVRKGSGGSNMKSVRGKKLLKRFSDNDTKDTVKLGWKDRRDTLLLFKQTEGHGVTAGYQWARADDDIAYATVPNYVYDYLIQADRAYSVESYKQEIRETSFDFDWSAGARTSEQLADMDERDVLLITADKPFDRFEEYGLESEIRSEIEDLLGHNIDSLAYVDKEDIEEVSLAFSNKGLIDIGDGPTIVTFGTGTPYNVRADYEINPPTLFYDNVVPDLDRDHDLWGRIKTNMYDDRMIEMLKTIQDNGGFPTEDSDDGGDDGAPQ